MCAPEVDHGCTNRDRALRRAVVDGEPVALIHQVERVQTRTPAGLLARVEGIQKRKTLTTGQRHRSIAITREAYSLLANSRRLTPLRRPYGERKTEIDCSD